MSKDVIELIVGLFPLLLLGGIWLYIMQRMGVFRKGAMTQSQYLEECVKEMKRTNHALETILTKMDERVAKLEEIRTPI
ncbi:MAG: hypothetical protein H7X92_13340 [Chitinophagales bacterium]|nr:hypothetical protein [Hyphomicrobiales bacterium]